MPFAYATSSRSDWLNERFTIHTARNDGTFFRETAKLDGLPLANGMAANDPRMNRAKPVLVDVRMQEAPRFVERKRKHIFRPKCFHRDPPTTEAWVIAEG